MIADSLNESSTEFIESIAKQVLTIEDISYQQDGWFEVEWDKD